MNNLKLLLKNNFESFSEPIEKLKDHKCENYLSTPNFPEA